MSATADSSSDTDEPVPKLPRGRGMKFSGPELFRIAVTLAILVAVIVLTKPCASAVSTFVMGMDGSGAKGSGMPKPGNVDVDPYEHLRPGMTDDEIKQAMERAKAKGPVPLPQGPGVGSGAPGGVPPGAPTSGGSAGSSPPGSAGTSVGSAARIGSGASGSAALGAPPAINSNARFANGSAATPPPGAINSIAPMQVVPTP